MKENDIRFRIAVGRQILHREGCASNVGGQVTARSDDGQGFWATGFSYFDQSSPQDVAQLSWDLQVIAGIFPLSAAMRTHAEIYKMRPDVNAIVHLHSHHITTLSSTLRTVGMFSVNAVLFHQNQILYADDGSKAHSSVAAELGENRVALMKNHGGIIASETLERAIIEAVTLEECARLHLDCVSAGGSEIAPAEVEAGVRNYAPHYLNHRWSAAYQAIRFANRELFSQLN